MVTIRIRVTFKMGLDRKCCELFWMQSIKAEAALS